MVLPSLFGNKSSSTTSSSKKSSKHHKHNHTSSSTPSHSQSHSQATPPSSPEKKSFHKFSSKDRDRGDRRSNSYSTSSNSRRSSRYDRDSHPLNLPPDELRRLSASMTDQPTPQAMDLDQDYASSPAPSSPTSNGFFPSKPNRVNGEAAPAAAPPQGPAPPPHRYATSPPPQNGNAPPKAPSPPPPAPEITAEDYKAAGNTFFKAKEYNKAIKEYTKGGEYIPVTHSPSN